MPAASVSKGTTISIKVGNAFVKIGGFLDFSGIGGGTAAVIDATDLDSTSKEKLMGIPDEGSIKLSHNLIAADPGQVALLAARGTQAVTDFELVLANKRKWAFSGYVKTFEPSAGVDKTLGLSSEIEITGAATVSTVAV
jgi:hypothetical protein